ncbi:MAG: hypothetical protein IKH04_00930 [Kiritimatiellae bacterium]|nr:hypothetical protein [Kiritimatiellia bacterium]
MKRLCKTLAAAIAAAILAGCIPALAGVPRTWDADVGSPAAFQTSAWQGETVELAAQLVRGQKPFAIPEGATAGLWWKTNGMDRYWGPAPATVSTNGVVSASWTPTNDVGAASYRGFLGVSLTGDGSNLTYAANFTLRMLESPGFAPNSLPLPVQSIDFSLVEVSNAPWIEEESDPTVPAWAKAPAPPAEDDPRFSEWLEFGFKMDVDACVSPALDEAMAYTDAVAAGLSPTGHVHDAADIASGTLSADRIPPLAASKITSGTLAAARIPNLPASKITSGTLSAARLPAATASDIGAVRPDGGTTTVASGVLSAQPALDSAMSYTDVSIGSITNSEFVATNGTLSLYAPWEGVMTNVWSSDAFAKTADVSALLSELQSLAARVRALEQNSGAGAQFWNRYAASGAANPDYENITVLNRAMTMFAAGFDIETSGAYGVFVQSGTVAFPSGGDGHFRLGVGTNAWFGIEVGGSVMVGAVAQSINVGDGVVFIDYPYSGTGDFPAIEMCTSLALMDWTTITPEWYDNGDGTATATCPATASSGFYRGWTSVTMSTRFSTTLPFEAKGGILCDDKIHVAYPVYNNGTITWSAQ